MSGLKRKYTATGSSSGKRSRRSMNIKDEIDRLRDCAELLEMIRTYRDSDNRLICESFIRAPSRRTDPEYFNVISHPIDLTRIQQKVKTEEYSSVDELCNDIHLLVNNNKKYYKEGSQQYKDASDLWDLFESRKKLLEGANSSNNAEYSPSSSRNSRISSRNDDLEVEFTDETNKRELFEELLVSILELTDEHGRLLSPPFRLLLSPEQFPLYYEKIKRPIDLKRIAEKIRNDEYRSWDNFESDFRLMCKNAKLFNETGSVINKDATTLLRYYMKRKADLIDQQRTHSAVITPDKMKSNKEMIDELIEQAPEKVNEDKNNNSEDSEEDDENTTDSKWNLYWTVRNEPSEADAEYMLSDPFLELPSKSWYPDYYDEINTPMSLFMINKKLKRGEYSTLSDLLDDILLVFKNAQSYNIEGSHIYKAAVKLHKIAIQKAISLEPELESKYALNDEQKTEQAAPNDQQPEQISSTDSQTPSSSPLTKPKMNICTPSSVNNSNNKHRQANHTANRVSKPGRKTMNELQTRYRDKLLALWNSAFCFMDGTRRVIDAFMVLPSRHEYPQYYDVIEKPVDMNIIKGKIDADEYISSDELITDIKLLFNNARTFNEPGSQIYRDSSKLESVVMSTLASFNDAPLFSPNYMKQKYGWVNTKLPSKHRARRSNAERLEQDSDNLSHDAELHSIRDASASVSVSTSNARSTQCGEYQQMIDLYSLIKNLKDHRGRLLSSAFLELPSKLDYPDYYDVIRKPIDMTKIHSRILSNYYESISALCSDFILMFDNACRYNEPESVIYKDALSLQKVVLQKKHELCEENQSIIDVQYEIRTLLTNILIAVNNHQDRDGRCYSDSLAEIASMMRRKGINEEQIPFSLDDIRINIDKGRYRRLDRFQDDLFALFDASRENSRSDSQIFEDSVELQMYYIKIRDELTRNTLISSARLFTEKRLLYAVDELRKKKIPVEVHSDMIDNQHQVDIGTSAEGDVELERIGQGGLVYRKNDYAYIISSNDSDSDNDVKRRHIMRIERIYKDDEGHCFIRGIWCYRPEETFHLATRKFIENEVFLTPYFDTVTVDRLMGKCHVMFIRNYLKEKPKGFDDKDVYVCESRYMGKQLHFKKMKQWPYKADDENVEYERRVKPLTQLSRVSSIFINNKRINNTNENDDSNDNLSQHSTTSSSTENDRLKKLPAVLQKHRVEVCVGTNNSNSLMNSDNKNDENITYYEQLEYNGDWYQLGDFVYVYNPVKNSIWILRIDKMWRVQSDDCYFSGPYFAKPTEIEHEPTRMFYKNELFAIEQPDITLPMLNIQKHCSVLLLKDYQKLRLTEVDEKDVYVVEYKVSGSEPANNKSSLSRSELNMNEVTDASAIAEDSMSESSAKKLKSLKVYHLSSEVLENEIYLFKTPITMEKEMSPLLMHTDTSSVPIEPLDDMDETASESLDGLEHTPGKELVSWLNAQPKISSRSKSGYILFSAEIRKRIMQENPEAGFGEVSKIVGIEWKKLSDEHKKQYETRAEYIANERAKQEAKQPTHLRLHPGQIRVFMCKWQACDFQFDHPDALYEHIKNAHTSKIVVGENQYVCLWTSCLKYRKEGKPFPSLPRLHRHIKEKHLTTAAKSIYPSQRSKNYYTNQQSSNTNNNNNDGTCSSTQQQSTSSNLNFNNNCSNVTNNNNNNPSTTTTYLTVPQSQLQPGTYTINTSHTPVSGFVTQAVIASGSQIVTNGYMNGNVSSAASTSNTNNNGSTLTAYIATTTPHAIVHTPNNSHAYHPYHQVRQVVSNQQPITLASSSSPLPTTTTSTINQQYTAVSIQPINTYQQQPIADPGRTIIQTAKEPVFVAPFNNVHIKRVMHSEAYLKYIESLSNAQQRHISKWNRSISANQYNTQSAQKSLPSNWLKDAKDEGARDEDIVKALWRLRNQLLESTLNIAREFEFVGPL